MGSGPVGLGCRVQTGVLRQETSVTVRGVAAGVCDPRCSATSSCPCTCPDLCEDPGLGGADLGAGSKVRALSPES